MSGRIRTVKPEWLEDELLALASAEARVLSIALMLLADDYGNGRANVVLLAGQVFPGKIPELTRDALDELAKIRFVAIYEVDGQRYFAIRNWAKHQRVDKPGRPRVPGPPVKMPLDSSAPEGKAIVPESRQIIPVAADNVPATRGSDPTVPLPVLVPGPGQDLSREPEAAAPQQSAATTELQRRYQLALKNMGAFVMDLGHEREEFLQVWFAWCKPFGITERPVIGIRIPRDIYAIVEAFAHGRSLEQLLHAGKLAETDQYVQERRASGGPSLFTGAVLMRLLKEPGAEPLRKRRGGPPQPDAGVDPYAKHDAKQGAS